VRINNNKKYKGEKESDYIWPKIKEKIRKKKKI
jgi:hypothetical protein